MIHFQINYNNLLFCFVFEVLLPVGSVQISYHSIFGPSWHPPLSHSIITFGHSSSSNYHFLSLLLHHNLVYLYAFCCIFNSFLRKNGKFEAISLIVLPPPPASLNYHSRSQPLPVYRGVIWYLNAPLSSLYPYAYLRWW